MALAPLLHLPHNLYANLKKINEYEECLDNVEK